MKLEIKTNEKVLTVFGEKALKKMLEILEKEQPGKHEIVDEDWCGPAIAPVGAKPGCRPVVVGSEFDFALYCNDEDDFDTKDWQEALSRYRKLYEWWLGTNEGVKHQRRKRL